MTFTVHDIDAYLRQQLEPRFGSLGLVQRHKLCYAVLRAGLYYLDRPLFPARVEAWVNGPVIRTLQDNPGQSGNPAVLDKKTRAICHEVVCYHAGMSGKRLIELSHNFKEWQTARMGLKAKERGNCEITLDMIRAVFPAKEREEKQNCCASCQRTRTYGIGIDVQQK